MKRKILSGIVIIGLLMSMLSGCGKNDELKVDSNSDAENTVNSNDEENLEEELNSQEELSDEEVETETLLIQKELLYYFDDFHNPFLAETCDYAYDSHGNLIRQTVYDADDGHLTYTYEYEYDNQGNKLREMRYNGSGDRLERNDYIYDNQGILVQIEDISSSGDINRVIKYVYDNNGNAIRADKIWKEGGVDWIEFAYDAQGNKSKELFCYPGDRAYSYLIEYNYNEHGLLESQLEYEDLKGIMSIEDLEGLSIDAKYRNEYSYDSQGNLIEYTRYNTNQATKHYVYEYATPEELGVYLGESDIETSNTNEDSVISDFSVVRDDFSRSTDNGRQIEMFFDKVIFEGSDDTIYWLNGQVESLEATYRKEYEEYIEDNLENLKELSYDDNWVYSPRELDSVYYDADYVSIGWSCLWYGGGVTDTEFVCMNYDLNSKSELTLYDILGENAYDIIVNALNKEDDSGYLSNSFNYSKMNEASFYFDKNTVYINFPDNVLDVSWSVSISVPR